MRGLIMGRHDEYAHFMHITKQMKFRPPKPHTASLDKRDRAPQTPSRKSNDYNQYRGHGRGV